MIEHSTFEVDGKKFTISVTDKGTFHTIVDHDSMEAETLEKLRGKISRSQRRKTVRISIPATIALSSSRYNHEDEKLVDVHITGIHQRNRSILYRRLDDGKAGDTSYNDTILKLLDDAGKAKYLKLLKDQIDAQTTFRKHKEHLTLNVERVKKQVRDAEKAQGIESAEDDD